MCYIFRERGDMCDFDLAVEKKVDPFYQEVYGL